MTQATIFNIQRFCIHDGPGIRTLVFFKGCPLRCLWCSNPESQQKERELLFDPGKCLRCGTCSRTCPTEAVRIRNGETILERGRCTLCGACCSVCPGEALSIAGENMSVEQVFEILMRDKEYFLLSGGGVTLSGGEASLYTAFIQSLCSRLREERISLALETCGVCDPALFQTLAEHIDIMLFDIKLLDKEAFRRYTGGDLDVVLENLRTARNCRRLIVRVPLIPGVNMDEQFYVSLGEMSKTACPDEIQLLPYHRLAEAKYRALGRPFWNTEPAAREQNQKARDQIAEEAVCPVKLVL